MISPYAATWRDDQGEVVATVYGGTVCQNPRSPRNLSAETDDGRYATIMRCRDCAGCRNYERLLLRRRLAEHFKDHKEDLWLVTLERSKPVPRRCVLPSSITSRLPNIMGMIRRGSNGLALIVAGAKPSLAVLRLISGWRSSVARISSECGAKGFSRCVVGLLTPRSEYGAQTNRFYVRGMPQLPKETFILHRQGGIRKSHPEAKAGMRAWRSGLTLYPSEKVRVTEWLSTMRSWRAQRLELSSVNRGRRGCVALSSSKATDSVAAPASPSLMRRAESKGSKGRRPVAASSFPGDQTQISEAGRDASSQSGLPAWAADFVARMTDLARKRGP